MLNLKDGRAELYQWDTGRRVTVPEDVTQVHYALRPMGRSLDVDVIGGEAEVPDVLLQVPGKLWVWAYVGSDLDGYTKLEKAFEIKRRNKPADYVFTPQEQKTLDEILERLKKLEESGGGVSVEIDDTLTIQGAAADAKVVGEKFAELPQADWNQDDETAKDYVKNRTHGEEITILGEYTSDKYVNSASMGVDLTDYAAYKTYIFELNGVEYELSRTDNYKFSAINEYVDRYGAKHSGTEWEDTNYPFCAMIRYSRNSCIVFFNEEVTAPISFKIIEKNVKQLDPKYIPFGVTVIDTTADDYNPLNNAYGNKVKEALLRGDKVYVYRGDTYASVSAFKIIVSTTEESKLRVYPSVWADTTGFVTNTDLKYIELAITL